MTDVHTEHCCKHHCKYGDENCTVVTGRLKQSFRCDQIEFCGIVVARIISEEELEEEASWRTIRCSNCRQWIRYKEEAVETRHETKQYAKGDVVWEIRFVKCPSCKHERVIGIR